MPTPVNGAFCSFYARSCLLLKLLGAVRRHPRGPLSPIALFQSRQFPFSAQSSFFFFFPLDYCSSSRLEVPSMSGLSFLVTFLVWIQLETVESTVSSLFPNFSLC